VIAGPVGSDPTQSPTAILGRVLGKYSDDAERAVKDLIFT
jgi:hypothetical protein